MSTIVDTFAECYSLVYFGQCHYAECRYAEFHGVELAYAREFALGKSFLPSLMFASKATWWRLPLGVDESKKKACHGQTKELTEREGSGQLTSSFGQLVL